MNRTRRPVSLAPTFAPTSTLPAPCGPDPFEAPLLFPSPAPSLLETLAGNVPPPTDPGWAVDPALQGALDAKRDALAAAERELAAQDEALAALDGRIATTAGALDRARGALAAAERALAALPPVAEDADPATRDAATSRLAGARDAVGRWTGEVGRLEQELATLRERRAAVATARDGTAGRIAGLRGEISSLEDRIASARTLPEVAPRPLPTAATVQPVPSPRPTPLPTPPPVPNDARNAEALEQVSKRVPPERLAKIEADVDAFQQATNTSWGAVDPKKTLQALSGLESPDEVEAFLALYNRKHCTTASGRERMTRDGLRERLANVLTDGDFLEASRRLDGDPVSSAAAAIRNATGDRAFELEGRQARAWTLGLGGALREGLSTGWHTATGGALWDLIGGAKKLVSGEIPGFERTDGQKILDAIAKLSPERRQRLLDEHPDLRDRIPELLRASPAKRELWSAYVDGPASERPQAEQDVKTELRRQVVLQRVIALRARTGDPAAVLDPDALAEVDRELAAIPPEQLAALVDARAAKRSEARIWMATMVDATVYGNDSARVTALLDTLGQDPALAALVAEQYGATRQRLRHGTVEGAERDGLLQLRRDVADRDLLDGRGVSVASPTPGATRTALHVEQLDQVGLAIEQAKLGLPPGLALGEWRAALDDPDQGPQVRERMVALGIDPARVVALDDRARENRAELRAARLAHGWVSSDLSGPGGVVNAILDPAYLREKTRLRQRIRSLPAGPERDAAEGQLAELDRREDADRRVMDAWVRRKGLASSVDALLATAGDGVPDLLQPAGDLYPVLVAAWRGRELPPEDLLLVGLPQFRGGSVDLEAWKSAFAGRSPEECDALLERFAAKYPDLAPEGTVEEVRALLVRRSGGYDEALEVMDVFGGDRSRVFDPERPPADPARRQEDARRRLALELADVERKVGFVRDGSWLTTGRDLLEASGELWSGRQSTAANVGLAHQALRDYVAKHRAALDSGDPAAWKEFLERKDDLSANARTNARSTADLTSRAVDTLKLAGAVLATAATLSGAGPLGIALLNLCVGGALITVEQKLSGGQMTDELVARRWVAVLIDSGVGLGAAKLQDAAPALKKLYAMDEEALKTLAATLSEPGKIKDPDLRGFVESFGKALPLKLIEAKGVKVPR